MKKVLGILIGLAMVMPAARVIAADVYEIDPKHSSITFTVKHLMVANVAGSFNDFKGTIAYDAVSPADFKADVKIATTSIDTNDAKRDDHLRAADFFDAAKYPEITFVSKSLAGGTLMGDLTMHGVTKEISIPVTISGPVKSPMGGDMVIGLDGETVINRQDFGIQWNKALDNGGLAVSNDVKVMVSFEAHKAPEAAAQMEAVEKE